MIIIIVRFKVKDYVQYKEYVLFTFSFISVCFTTG